MSAPDVVDGALRGTDVPQGPLEPTQQRRGRIVAEIMTIELDIAKSLFQVNASMRQASRCPPSVASISRAEVLRRAASLRWVEACSTSHYWSRQLQSLGDSVKLMPPSYVKLYVKRQKNDMADAEAICEAVCG
jgi:transposase